MYKYFRQGDDMKYLIALMLAAVSVPALASADLAKSKNCMACHAVDRKLVGPAFKDIAGRYTAKDTAQLVTSIQKGGSGKWGPIPMPANTQVTNDEAKLLVEWILKQK
jgi:cytochrome c